MITIIDGAFAMSFFLSSYAGYVDNQKGIIPNAVTIPLFFLNLFYLSFNYGLLEILKCMFPIVLLSMIFFFFKIWGAGDSKMLMAVSPLSIAREFAQIPSWHMFLIIFLVPISVYAFLKVLKEETPTLGYVFPFSVYLWWYL